MGIFLPTKVVADIVIYSKWCVRCDYPDELNIIDSYAQSNKLHIQIIRTAYRPADHAKATDIWHKSGQLPASASKKDAENYPTFCVYNNATRSIKDFCTMITDSKNKLVKQGDTKNDMQRLPKAKGHRRKNSLADQAHKTKIKNENQ